MIDYNDSENDLIYLREERHWEAFVKSFLGDRKWLLHHVARTNGNQRVFMLNDQFVKVVYHPDDVMDPLLEREYSVLKRITAIGDLHYERIDRWEVLSMPRVPGDHFDVFWESAPMRLRARALMGAVRAVNSVNRLGISHRDLRSSNLIVDSEGNVRVIDFGQSVTAPWPMALANDLVGLPWSSRPEVSLARTVVKVGAPWLRSRLPRWDRMRSKRWGSDAQFAALLDESANDIQSSAELTHLFRAWLFGASSQATAKGQAYYSLDVGNIHFPGERPWVLRWELIRSAVTFSGKSVVELGCNLGLLSSSALLHGARAARGVDRNRVVLEGAKEVARAWGVDPTFAFTDVDLSPDWELQCAGADIVAAMSLYHWVSKKERLLAFLAQQPEVLYEGHDPIDIERQRLMGCGFDTVQVLGQTERGRWLLHASRAG